MQICLNVAVNNHIEELSNMIQDIIQHSKDDKGKITELLNIYRPCNYKPYIISDINNTLLTSLKEYIHSQLLPKQLQNGESGRWIMWIAYAQKTPPY